MLTVLLELSDHEREADVIKIVIIYYAHSLLNGETSCVLAAAAPGSRCSTVCP